MTPTSRRALQVLVAAPSAGLALVTALGAPRGSLVAGAVLIVLTAFVVLTPSSRLTAVLLALHAANWVSCTNVPASARDWTVTLLAALALLTIHLAAALASAMPPAAPLPRVTVNRWVRRGLTVVALSIPVWALLIAQTSGAPAGVPLITYAAVASLAILALAFWLAQLGNTSSTTLPTPHPAPPGPDGR